MIEAIVMLAILLLMVILFDGVMKYSRIEAKGCKWIAVRKRKPVTITGEKKGRFLVSLETGDVIIDTYDFERREFLTPYVEAWRPLPLSYGHARKVMMGIIGRIRRSEKG